jgi:hypothetical protein
LLLNPCTRPLTRICVCSYADDAPAHAAAAAAAAAQPTKPSQPSQPPSEFVDPVQDTSTAQHAAYDSAAVSHDTHAEYDGGEAHENGANISNGSAMQADGNSYSEQYDNYGPIGIKEDG